MGLEELGVGGLGEVDEPVFSGLAEQHRRPRPAEPRPSHGEHILTPRARPSHASQHTPYASHRTMEDDMNSMNDTGVVAGSASGQTSHTHRLRGLAGTGFVATLAAMVATTLAAALAQAVGVDFEVPDGGESVPLSGFAVVTGFFSVVGIVIAVGLLRWSARPAARFVWTAVSLTAISLVPPLLSGANTATTSALLGLHLVPATVMIPTLTRSLPGWPGRVRRRRR
jgi:hypothetical protein